MSKSIHYTFCVTDRTNVYDVTVYNSTITKVVKFFPDSGIERELHFDELTPNVQDLIITKMQN
jgi:hypothetical protein